MASRPQSRGSVTTPTPRPASRGRESATGSPIAGHSISRKSTLHLGLLTLSVITDQKVRSSRLAPAQLQTPRESIRRSRTITPSHIARPEGVSLADRTAKRNKSSQNPAALEMSAVDKRHEEYLNVRIRQLQTPKGETAIARKEEILEMIMAAEAQAGFMELARNQLDRRYVTRVGVDPTLVPGLRVDSLSHLVDDGDLAEDCLESDDELVGRCGLQECQLQPGDDQASVDASPEEIWAGQGLRVGFGMPQVAGRGEELLPERLFTGRCGPHRLVGVVNAHGDPRIAGELALFIAEVMPSAVFRSGALAAKHPDFAVALTDTFRRVHRSASLEFDLSLTGASCTVVLLEAEHVWIAHVGDCRAILGAPDPRENAQEFHFVPIKLTEDHKPALNAEFDRVHSSRGQMRHLVDDDVMRIFLRDGAVPGLTLTRAIGHRVGHSIGISHEPTIAVMRREDIEKGSFLVIGSGGIWASMSERNAVNWVSRYFADPGEAADSLACEALNRWEDSAAHAKRCLRRDVTDCFSAALIFFDDEFSEAAAAEPRPPPSPMVKQRTFVSGPKNELPKKEWSQVKSVERTRMLKKLQSFHQQPEQEPEAMVSVNRRRYE